MNKKIVTLILVILISFCFLSIVVADNAIHNDNNTTDHDKTVDNTTDNNKTPDKNDTDDKSKNNYILAKGKGNVVKFSDGFRGFILDYSKSPADLGDEFERVSTSSASNSNTLKLAIIECYKHNSTGKIGKIMADFIKTGSSSTPVGEAVAASHKKVSDHEVVKINNHTEAVFDFEVLKSVSGNESDYFAYKVSLRAISAGEDTNQTNSTNQTNNTTNITNMTNITNITQLLENETFLAELFDYLESLASALFEAWEPLIETLMNEYLMIIHALEELTKMFENIMAEIQSLFDAFEKLLNMLESLWKEIDGFLKLVGVLLTALEQLFNLIGSILNFIAGLISSIIALVQQLLGLLFSVINFIIDLIIQIVSLIQAILDFLKAAGSFLIKVIENGLIIVIAFVLVTIGAFVYNRIR